MPELPASEVVGPALAARTISPASTRTRKKRDMDPPPRSDDPPPGAAGVSEERARPKIHSRTKVLSNAGTIARQRRLRDRPRNERPRGRGALLFGAARLPCGREVDEPRRRDLGHGRRADPDRFVEAADRAR